MTAAKERPLPAGAGNDPKQKNLIQPTNPNRRCQPQSDLAGLIASVNLPAVVETAGVILTRRGDRHSGLCPFHSERTPSFFVFQDGQKGRYNCFGCGAGGDAIDFVQAVYRLDFNGALAHLGFSPDPMTPELSQRIKRNRHGAELVYSFRKWVDRQIDAACFVIHTCSRRIREIKSPDDLEKHGHFYHLQVVAEYHHEWLCEASDKELFSLFREGGFYAF